jgi:hypothetical protein
MCSRARFLRQLALDAAAFQQYPVSDEVVGITLGVDVDLHQIFKRCV